ncbi:MAG: Ig-like domain repeat protein [Methanobrevibacter sp.]|nr:Ig-like domain repeat protein [Methanobrevibacter sp.]
MFSIASVCAGEVDNKAIVSEDNSEFQLSQINEIENYNLETSEDDIQITQSNNGETICPVDNLSAHPLHNKLSGTGEGNYSDLRSEIGPGGDVNLSRAFYNYADGDGDTIEITSPGLIDGNGAIIDMAGSNIRAFCVNASNVTIKNLTIKNANFDGDGGAIYFSGLGTVENCNFINNSASNGGAVFGGTAILCTFETSSDILYETELQPTFIVSDFNSTYASGDKLIFNLTYDNQYYDGYNATINITQDGAPVGVYHGLSGVEGGWNVDLIPGTYNATLSLVPYAVNPASIRLTVNKASPKIEVSASDVYYPNDLIITVKSDVSGNYVVKVGERVEFVTLESGLAQDIVIGGLNACDIDYVINVSYEDEIYSGCNDSEVVKVKKASSISGDFIALNVTVKDSTMFVVNVNEDFNGNVSILAEEKVLYNGSVKTLIIGEKLLAGDKAAIMVFYGDSNYENIVKDVDFTVSRVTPDIDVAIEDVTYPRDAYAYVQIGNSANGTVNVTVDGKTFNQTVHDGFATVALSGLSAGYKEAKIEFVSRDDYNYDVNASKRFIVYPNNSLIEIFSDSTHYVGDTVEIMIRTQNSTGDIKVYLNGEFKSQFPYNYWEPDHFMALDDLLNGTYNLEAFLDGDENYTGYSTSFTFHVEKRGLEITMNDIDSVIYVDSPVNLTADLNETVTGDVIFNINGINYTVRLDNTNVASYEYTPVDNSTLSVFAIFVGNERYNSTESDSKDFIVNRIPVDIGVSLNFTAIHVGEKALVTITMNPRINTIAKLAIGDESYDVAIRDGVGTFEAYGLAYGSYLVNASFAGDSRYAYCDNWTSLEVNKIDNYKFIVAFSNITFPENETIRVVLPADIESSKLTVKVDGEIRAIDFIENGVAIITVPGLTVGRHELNVSYEGDDNYEAKDKNSSFIVYSPETCHIKLYVINDTYGKNTTFKVTINNDVSNNVTLSIDGESYFLEPDDVGFASLTLNNLTGGLHEVTATYPGDEIYSRVSQSSTFIIPCAESSIHIDFESPKLAGDDLLISVSMDQAVDGEVKLIVGEDSYFVTLAGGAGNCIVHNLQNGSYDVKAVFNGNENYLGSISDVKQLEVNNIPLTLSIALNKSSILVGEDASLSINLNQSIDGFVTVRVNEENYAVSIFDGKGDLLLSGLPNGTYLISAVFSSDNYGEVASNNVTLEVNRIETILVANSITVSYDANRQLVITLKDSSGNVLSGLDVDILLNGENIVLTTDKNGQVRVSTKDLVPDIYTATISFAGNSRYVNSTKYVDLTVKKASVKLTAVNKVLKALTKTKTYTVTLKNNQNKALKNEWVTLKVNNQTYKVQTNSKGQAIFKITNLNKKGTFNLVVMYEGSNFYDAVTVNRKITLK